MAQSQGPHASPLQLSTYPLYGGALTVSLPRDMLEISAMVPCPDNQEIFRDPEHGLTVMIELQQRIEESTSVAATSAGLHGGPDESAADAAHDAGCAALREHVEDIWRTDLQDGEGVSMRWIEQPTAVDGAAEYPGYLALFASGQQQYLTPTTTNSTNDLATASSTSSDPSAPSQRNTSVLDVMALYLLRYTPPDGNERRAADLLTTVLVKFSAEEAGGPSKGREQVNGDATMPKLDVGHVHSHPRVRRALMLRDAVVRSLTVVDHGLFAED